MLSPPPPLRVPKFWIPCGLVKTLFQGITAPTRPDLFELLNLNPELDTDADKELWKEVHKKVVHSTYDEVKMEEHGAGGLIHVLFLILVIGEENSLVLLEETHLHIFHVHRDMMSSLLYSLEPSFEKAFSGYPSPHHSQKAFSGCPSPYLAQKGFSDYPSPHHSQKAFSDYPSPHHSQKAFSGYPSPHHFQKGFKVKKEESTKRQLRLYSTRATDGARMFSLPCVHKTVENYFAGKETDSRESSSQSVKGVPSTLEQ
ncbi:hypothetical protein A6R68_04841 [Neotoma lepida]|uniref:Uncharacterized protein n=1 Tax=Neotoma lepida TaxID=56216 RepID=A0A1A6GK21_NEOLE|nr:hypothetical protein A6R68_04841 [Neotoma lepida]